MGRGPRPAPIPDQPAGWGWLLARLECEAGRALPEIDLKVRCEVGFEDGRLRVLGGTGLATGGRRVFEFVV